MEMSNGNVLVASLGSHGSTVVGDEVTLGVPRTGVTRGRGANPLRVVPESTVPCCAEREERMMEKPNVFVGLGIGVGHTKVVLYVHPIQPGDLTVRHSILPPK